jgi:hypothetical protein
MKVSALGMLIVLGGCVTTDRDVAGYLDRYYTRSEIDALNTRQACKQLARTLIQIARCDVRQ